MDPKFNPETLASVAGTLIGDALAVTEERKKVFLLYLADYKLNVENSEKEIGTLTPIELAFFAAADLKNVEAEAIKQSVTSKATEGSPEVRQKYSLLNTEVKILQKTAWGLIKARIGTPAEEAGSLFLRAEGTIAAFEKSDVDFIVIKIDF